MEWIIIYLIFCALIGYGAAGTNLGFWGGFLLSIIFTPIIGFIIMLFYPNKGKQEARDFHTQQQTELLKKIASSSQNKATIEERLSKLEEVKSKQLITEEEYQQKRNQILSEI